MKHLLYSLAALVVVLSILFVPAHARAEDINSMVTNAKTAADHEAIAKHYDAVAADLNAKADEHNNLITAYSNVPRSSANDKHCDKMIRDMRDGAKEAAALAEAHRQMAAAAK